MKGNNNRPWEGLGGGVYSTYSTRGNHHDLRVNSRAIVGVQLGETQLAKTNPSGVVTRSDLPLWVGRFYFRSDSLHVRSGA